MAQYSGNRLATKICRDTGCSKKSLVTRFTQDEQAIYLFDINEWQEYLK